MAHFAKLENNTVTQVVVVSNDDCAGGNYPESESAGQEFLALCGLAGHWLQTSYTGSFRGRYAGIGYTYDSEFDEFIAPTIQEK